MDIQPLIQVLPLSGDVLLHRFEIGLAHGEIRVAGLPLEVGIIVTAFLQPEVRDAFQFLLPFRLRDGASEAREQMDVVFHAAAEDGWAIELFGDAAEIRVQRVARVKTATTPLGFSDGGLADLNYERTPLNPNPRHGQGRRFQSRRRNA
jgi:hypothetical protein